MLMWYFTKMFEKVVFNDIHNKEYSKSTIKAPRNSAKTCPKLSKILKEHDRHCCGIPVVEFRQVPYPMKSF